MNKDNNKSYFRNIPVLDIHIHNKDEIKNLINDFIKEIYNKGYDKCIIICGRGSHETQKITKNILDKNELVKSNFESLINDGNINVRLVNSREENRHLTKTEINEMKQVVEHLSVKNINIRYLFGKFKYNVEFSNRNKIYLIHAPNGCGKSTFISYIDSMMNNKEKELKKGAFGLLTITCENNIGDNFVYEYDTFNKKITCNDEKLLDILPECLIINNLEKKDNLKSKLIYSSELERRKVIFNDIMDSFFNYEKKVYFAYDKIMGTGNSLIEIGKKGYKKNVTIEYTEENDSNIPNLFQKGDLISFNNLSTGEQAIIKLFYGLIFNLKTNGFVIIDEPEISLHPEWQELLVKKLVEVSNLFDIRILIATHSPYLLNNLDVKVGNPEYEK